MPKNKRSRKKSQSNKENKSIKDEAVQKHEKDTREIENLMRHDAYDRGRGGIRQIRRG